MRSENSKVNDNSRQSGALIFKVSTWHHQTGEGWDFGSPESKISPRVQWGVSLRSWGTTLYWFLKESGSPTPNSLPRVVFCKLQVYARNPRKKYMERTHVVHPVKIATPPCQGSNKPLEKMILDATLLMLMPPNLKTQELTPKHQGKRSKNPRQQTQKHWGGGCKRLKTGSGFTP